MAAELGEPRTEPLGIVHARIFLRDEGTEGRICSCCESDALRGHERIHGERGAGPRVTGTRARVSRGSTTMIVSTTPLSERPDWHPVHRANALLRSALLNEAAFFPKPGLTQPFDAIAGTPDGPVGIAYPQSLVARLN